MAEYTLLGVERPNDEGQVRGIGPAGSIRLPDKPPTARSKSLALPSATTEVDEPVIILIDGWIYIVGVKPVVGTDEILTGSEASSLIVQKEGTTTRAILLESFSDGFVQKLDGSGRIAFTEGYYVEIVNGNIGAPKPFDANAFVGAADLMNEVDIARQHWNLP